MNLNKPIQSWRIKNLPLNSELIPVDSATDKIQIDNPIPETSETVSKEYSLTVPKQTIKTIKTVSPITETSQQFFAYPNIPAIKTYTIEQETTFCKY